MDIKKYEQSGGLIKDINKEFYEGYLKALNECHDQELQKLKKANEYYTPKKHRRKK